MTNPDAQSATLTNGFTYSNGMAPTISLVSPNYGPVAGGATITVTGSQFMNGALVTIGGVACNSITFVSSTSLTCITPPGSNGAKSVVVTNPDAQSATLTNSFTYSNGMAPVVTALYPNFGPLAGGTTVNVIGSQFMNGARVTIGGISCDSITFNSSTSLTCVTPAGSAGAKAVVVTNPDAQSATLANGFTYSNGMAPTISTVTPNSGPLAGGTTITIIGSGFIPGAVVTIGGISCDTIVFLSTTSLTCVSPIGTLGAKSVIVTNPDNQSATLSSGFTYVYSPTFLYAILGAEDGARLGSAVTTMDDLNGDGRAEFAVSQLRATVSGLLAAGTVYVFRGSDGALLCTLQSPSPIAEGQFGSALAYGDMNQDGRAELIVGEPGATVSSLARAGRVHVFNGDSIRTCGATTLSTALRSHEAASPEASGRFGFSLAAGLISADANFDIIVGEPGAAGGGVARGRVSTFDGSNGNALFSPLVAVSANDLASYGFAVAAVDMNGDGRSDIAIGEPGAAGGGSYRGRVYVYSGVDGTTQLFTALNGSNTTDFRFGYSLANAGRVNADSREDLVVGEPFATYATGTTTFTNRGRVIVYSYTSGASATTLWTINSPAENDIFFGLNVAGVGDMDGDSFSDFLVTAPYTNAGGTTRGRVTVFRGSMGFAYLTVSGLENGALFGRSAASAGDIDGDGYPDLLIGEPEAANSVAMRGKAYVYIAP